MAGIFKRIGIFDSFLTAGLFCFFTVSVVFVLLSGVQVYRSTTDSMNEHYENNTLLTYLSVKLKHYDKRDGIEIGQVNDIDALVFCEVYGNEIYKTYIYCFNGYVCELFTRGNVMPSVELGEKIIPADKLTFLSVKPSLVKIICQNRFGESYAFIHLRSSGTPAADDI